MRCLRISRSISESRRIGRGVKSNKCCVVFICIVCVFIWFCSREGVTVCLSMIFSRVFMSSKYLTISNDKTIVKRECVEIGSGIIGAIRSVFFSAISASASANSAWRLGLNPDKAIEKYRCFLLFFFAVSLRTLRLCVEKACFTQSRQERKGRKVIVCKTRLTQRPESKTLSSLSCDF